MLSLGVIIFKNWELRGKLDHHVLGICFFPITPCTELLEIVFFVRKKSMRNCGLCGRLSHTDLAVFYSTQNCHRFTQICFNPLAELDWITQSNCRIIMLIICRQQSRDAACRVNARRGEWIMNSWDSLVVTTPDIHAARRVPTLLTFRLVGCPPPVPPEEGEAGASKAFWR